MKVGSVESVKIFSKLNYFIFGYFDPTNIFFDNEKNILRGDLSGISAKTATLEVTLNIVPFMTQRV